jgi:tetraacyldisaccharide 4'-kinase
MHGGSGWRTLVRRFWDGETGAPGTVLRLLLYPLELVYHAVISVRNLAYDRGWLHAETAPVPIVSVGNLTVGGTGKTPFARWLVSELERKGARPAILHGGYADDEPLLHRQWYPHLPVHVGRDRLAGARAAADEGATVAVVDDGFQHRRLRRDIDFVLIAAEDWSGKRALLPRGPWREPASSLDRAHAIVVTRKSVTLELANTVASQLREMHSDKPVIVVAIKPAGWLHAGESAAPPAVPGLAVAAIARPDAFVENAGQAGAQVAELLAFPDHHGYSSADRARIVEAARGRPILTTAKDAVKLADLIAETDVWILEQIVEIEVGRADVERLLGEVTS